MTIKTKYNIGDKVWSIYSDKLVEFTVASIMSNQYLTKIDTFYRMEERTSSSTKADFIVLKEDKLFSSKEEYIKSL